MTMIIDAHLDLAYNAVTRGRDVRKPAREQPVVDNEIATVGLPDLRAGNVGLICATLFAPPATQRRPHGYRTSDEAHAQVISQLAWYREQFQGGLLQLVRTHDELRRDADFQSAPNTPHGLEARVTGVLSAILLMEGADPIRTPGDVKLFHDAGVRIVGLAWGRTRYAGGTGAPGPLTPEGRGLVRVLDEFGIIHDASHLSDESFRDLLEVTGGPVIASHSNCRAIVPGDRHLSDEMIRALIARGGVIGINFYDQFLLPPAETRRATLADVVRHVRHICDLAGNASHVALGTDMDGGLGLEEIPQEIETSADLLRVGDALRAHDFAEKDVDAILGQNWFRFFHAQLPAAGQDRLST